MKIVYILLLIFISIIVVYGKEYELKYESVPKSINCDINIYINNQKDKEKFTGINNVKINTKSVSFEDNVAKYTTNIRNKNYGKSEINKECVFQIENKRTFYDVKKLSLEEIYGFADINEKIFTGQLIFNTDKVEIGKSWTSTISNPLSGGDLVITNRITRVADGMATIYFSGKNPYRDNHIKTEKELMTEKQKIGSTFYLNIGEFYGQSEINCSGFWIFNVNTGQILVSNQYYKINSLMRKDDNAPIESFYDFFYADVFMTIYYEYEY